MHTTEAPTATHTPEPLPTADPLPGCVLYPSAVMPRPIPDNQPDGIVSSIFVPQPAPELGAVRVRIDSLAHTYVSDLRLILQAPGGTEVVLAHRVGNDTDNFYRTVFDDNAPTPVSVASGPFTGAFRPDQPLADLAGETWHGVWQLRVADVEGADTGILYAWTLELCQAPERLYMPLLARQGAPGRAALTGARALSPARLVEAGR